MEETTWGDSEHRWVRPGQLFTRGPGAYKIPSFNDVPLDMRVKLMNRKNPLAVHSSKVSRSRSGPGAGGGGVRSIFPSVVPEWGTGDAIRCPLLVSVEGIWVRALSQPGWERFDQILAGSPGLGTICGLRSLRTSRS